VNKNFSTRVLALLLIIVAISHHYSVISCSAQQKIQTYEKTEAQKPTLPETPLLPVNNPDQEDTSPLLYEDSLAHLDSSFSSGFLRAIFSLLAVIGLIYLFLFLLRKFSGTPQNIPPGNEQVFGIRGRLSLSPKKIIYLVQAGEKILVLGVDEQIRLLSIIEDETTIQSLKSQFSPVLSVTKFSDYFKNFLSFKKNKLLSRYWPRKLRTNWKYNND